MSYLDNVFPTKKCAVCGKVFYPAPMHVFHRDVGNVTKWFCGYLCEKAYADKHPINFLYSMNERKARHKDDKTDEAV